MRFSDSLEKGHLSPRCSAGKYNRKSSCELGTSNYGVQLDGVLDVKPKWIMLLVMEAKAVDLFALKLHHLKPGHKKAYERETKT